jgi:outer membrane protein OmpA-like peptidoglycan-associated protein
MTKPLFAGTRTSLPLLLGLLLSFPAHPNGVGTAQESRGKWCLGIQGGVNVFLTDFNDRRIGPGASLSLRYGISEALSLGVSAGYEELKTKQTPKLPSLPYDYVKLHALPASVNIWYRLLTGGTLTPYVYAGAGVLLFQRQDGSHTYFTDESLQSSLMIPAGAGLEVQLSRRATFTFECGYRIGNDRLETYELDFPDTYPTAKAGVSFFLGSGRDADSDEDGLTDTEEETGGTDPEVADSDGDGLSDGAEIRLYRTNPLHIDTDGDGLGDGDEVTKYHTDPARSDTDADDLIDGDEVARGTDPLQPDTDGDGLNDGEEVSRYKSNPLATDSDGDGLSDGDEANTFRSKPGVVDTDGDGLPDGEEVNVHRSDPTTADTDGGGVPDGVEVARQSNPLNPRDDMYNSPLVLQRGAPVVLEGVTFESGSAYLTAASLPALEKGLAALMANPRVKVEIVGYTDNVGLAEANEIISRKRAEAVRTWLVRKGISALRLTVSGRGMRNPVASNDTPEGRARNRRIEFSVLE